MHQQAETCLCIYDTLAQVSNIRLAIVHNHPPPPHCADCYSSSRVLEAFCVSSWYGIALTVSKWITCIDYCIVEQMMLSAAFSNDS